MQQYVTLCCVRMLQYVALCSYMQQCATICYAMLQGGVNPRTEPFSLRSVHKSPYEFVARSIKRPTRRSTHGSTHKALTNPLAGPTRRPIRRSAQTNDRSIPFIRSLVLNTQHGLFERTKVVIVWQFLLSTRVKAHCRA